MNLTAKGTK